MVKNVLPNRRKMLLAGLLLPIALGRGSSSAVAGAEVRADGPVDAGDVIVDWRSGLALHGIDPVAYFSEGKAVRGLPEIEYLLAGVVWRFLNLGNRAGFAADPAAYLPRFAGYDPIAAGRGVATPGNPLIWLIHQDRLYLFYEARNRAAFAAGPESAIAAGLDRWPELRTQLDATGSIVPVKRVSKPPDAA